MIRKTSPAVGRTYRGSRVIRKGEAGWKSDHPERLGESYGTNPTSGMQAAALRAKRGAIHPSTDPNTLPVDAVDVTGDGRDAFKWVVVAVEDRKRPGEMLHVWKLHSTIRNGDL